MLLFLRRIVRPLARELRRRQDLRELLEKDDRILRDIGLTRVEVERALRRCHPAGAMEHLHLTTQRLPAMQAPY
jgi:uncharacterized protein YjiS (DUF1127 family)